ncbi:MAG: non-specific endonuclease, partial [Bryobacterales bacterium]|nr:non-specific endonuclease [Bryobacterales bacterium]
MRFRQAEKRGLYPNNKRGREAFAVCPNCRRSDSEPDSCAICLLLGCEHCIARHAHCNGCNLTYNAFDPPPHVILGQDGWNNVCCTQNGAVCCCGEVYRTQWGATHSHFGLDSFGQQCCAQNATRCQGCQQPYRNLAGPSHPYYGTNNAGQHCCAISGGRCQGCGVNYLNADGAPHGYLGLAPGFLPCCAANGGQCPGCGAIYRNTNGPPHSYYGPDAAMQPCCAQNGARCQGCGEPYRNSNGAPHAVYGNDRASQPCCSGNGGQCLGCGAIYRNTAGPPHPYYGPDAAMQPCCGAYGRQCPGCQANYRTAAGAPHAVLGNDGNGQAVCLGNGRMCATCGLPGRNADHQEFEDLEGHRMCPGSGAQCPHCGLDVCTAICGPEHKRTSTCHGDKCIRSVCAECEGCSVCRGALTIDLCATCADVIEETVDHLKVRHQLVPGQAAQVRRQLTITGSIRPKAVGNRTTPPPSLSTLEVKLTLPGMTPYDDILEMKQFDRGHLVALELRGFDDTKNIVPMNYRFNRSGKWRTMETTIGNLMKGTDATDINGGTVRATPAMQSTVGLTLKRKNNLATHFEIEIWLYYDDARGDPRVPVWFYVRLLKSQHLIAHFSMGNRCDKSATMPHADEFAEFAAAEFLFRSVDAHQLKNIKLGAWFERDDELFDTLLPANLSVVEPEGYKKPSDLKLLRKLHTDLGKYVVGDPFPAVPPNQLLQFMWDVNQAADHQGFGVVFQTMELGAQKESTPYDSFQREYIRAFKRWKTRATGGNLPSDAVAGAYAG